MSFSSIHFLFLFLPIFIIFYYLLNRQWYRNLILVTGSLIFFGWVAPGHIPLILAFTLANFLAGILIDFFQKKEMIRSGSWTTWVFVVLDIGVLFIYKYLGFFSQSLGSLMGLSSEAREFLLPLGISYYTFSAVSYLVDIHQQVIPAEKNLLRFSAYLTMFPKLIQGPITRFAQMRTQLNGLDISRERITDGVHRLIQGLAKKILIADTMAVIADRVFSADYSTMGMGVAWAGILAYTLQIYFDFSGYTDMALGLGKMLGFELPENFNYPYIARSISDFWRRWHMSLTAWFRTYVFLPLEYFRKKERFLRQQSNLVIVFLLTGLWHGSGWNFILWGVYYGILLALETSSWGNILKKSNRIIQHGYTLLLVIVGWVIFRITDIGLWKPFAAALLGVHDWTGEVNLRMLNILFYLPVMVMAIILSTPLLNRLERRLTGKGMIARILVELIYLVLFIASILFLLRNGYDSFLYTQF